MCDVVLCVSEREGSTQADRQSKLFRKKVAGAPRLKVGGRLGPKKGELESCSQLGCSFRPCVDWLGRAGLLC